MPKLASVWLPILGLGFLICAGAAHAAPMPSSSSTPPPSNTPAAAPSPAVESGSLQPGATITSANSERFSKSLPAAARSALKLGFRIRVSPTERLEWSAGFERATEKYSPQVGLDAKDQITNYIAGMPFPLIDAADPKAAVKIAYNWHMGPVMPDDFSLAPWSSNGYAVSPSNRQKILPVDQADFACEEFEFLRFAHRTEVDPRPTLGATSMGWEWKARCKKWLDVTNAGGTAEGAGIWVRFLDPSRADEFYGLSEASRRVRRSAVNLEFPTEGCRGCHQPYWAYALPKTENYSYRLLGTTTVLACMKSDHEPAGIAQTGDGYSLTEEPFQLRHAYILEMAPRTDAHGPNTRAVIFIDSEIYVWLAAEFFDDGQPSAATIPLWHMKPSPEGGNLFDLAGSFYFPEARPGYFRSLVPVHPQMTQKINSGDISEGGFNPQTMH